jgi:hypothetical protein
MWISIGRVYESLTLVCPIERWGGPTFLGASIGINLAFKTVENFKNWLTSVRESSVNRLSADLANIKEQCQTSKSFDGVLVDAKTQLMNRFDGWYKVYQTLSIIFVTYAILALYFGFSSPIHFVLVLVWPSFAFHVRIAGVLMVRKTKKKAVNWAEIEGLTPGKSAKQLRTENEANLSELEKEVSTDNNKTTQIPP